MKQVSAITNKAKALKNKVKYAMTTLALAAAFPDAYADSGATSVLNNILGAVFTVMQFGGIVMAALGVFEIVKSTQDTGDSHSLARGLSMAVGGAVMIFMKPLLTALGVTTSISGLG